MNYKNLPDDLTRILTKAQKGDKTAEDALFNYLRVRFTFLAKRRIGGEDAEDVAHDACMTVLNKYKTYGHHGQFEAWAYKILRNSIGNYLQHRKIVQGRQTGDAFDQITTGSHTDYANPSLLPILLRCLKKLIQVNKLYARALNLAHQGFTTEEICARLKIKPNHFYVALNRGRKALNKCMEKGEM